MEAKRYRKRPVEVEAIQFTDNPNEVAEFIGDEDAGNYGKCDFMDIETLEGDLCARPGDYIIKGVQGEFYPCKPEIFHATYEEA